jgi:hypothetical protein
MLKAPDYLSVPSGTPNGCRLAAICCLFEVNGDPRVMRNYWRFVESLRRIGLPLYTIECVREGQEFFIPQGPTVLRRVAKTLGWHKERLLNILARYVPPRFTKLAWLDADVLLHNPSWAYDTERLLDHYHVVQPFSAARWLDCDDRTVPEVYGPDVKCLDGVIAAIAGGEVRHSIAQDTHPGFAWAMRRDTWLRLGGLCEGVLSMVADALMVSAFLDSLDYAGVLAHRSQLRTVSAWFSRAVKVVNRSVTFVPGMADHMWHGYLHNRQYASLTDSIFNLAEDLNAAVIDDAADPENQPRITQSASLLAVYQQYFSIRNGQ